MQLPLFFAAFLSTAVLASPLRPHDQATTRLIYEFAEGSWLENIASRSNGDLLLTSFVSPGYLTLLSNITDSPVPTPITGFDFTSTLGITETEEDNFYVIGSNFSLETVSTPPGTTALWHVDFRESNGRVPTAKKAVDLPAPVFLNGLTTFNHSILLASDSYLGAVWAIDLVSNTSWIVADDPLMKPVSGQPYLEGINGLHIRPSRDKERKTLCFTNSQQYIFACIELDSNARAVGSAKTVAVSQPEGNISAISWDDFAFDQEGTAYVATEIGNSVQSVSPSGRVAVVAGALNSTAIAQPTSTTFGRGAAAKNTLYVATGGGLAIPVIQNGQSIRIGAQVVAVDLKRSFHG